ncbi:MAG: glycosyltransferase family 2 protein [Marinilabiliales bacterium]|nr:MAG: glycosyltransferase family 2 protein [Marinilabiliales bacterium]
MKKLAVVILNWNGEKLLRRFLPGVVEHSLSEHAGVWVADNGSTDGSAEFVKREFPGIGLITLDRNYGFAGGYNRALAGIKAEYYILLNSDVEVTPGWTAPLLDLMEGDSRVAACMPKILDLEDKGRFEYAGAAGGFIDFLGYPFCRGRIFDVTEEDNGQYDDVREVFWATGACMAVRAEDWKLFGGFDSGFFAHMEEIDLCWRMKSGGRRIMVCPASVVYHQGGGTLPGTDPRKTFLNFRNSLSMLLRNLPGDRLWLVLVRLIGDWLSIVKFIAALSFGNAFAVLRAHFAFFGLLAGNVRKRREIRRLLLSLPAGRDGEIVSGEAVTGETAPRETAAGETASGNFIPGKSYPLAGMYRRSIVVDFFILRRRVFSRLGFGD